MATTRIMPLHIGKGRTENRAISEIIDYVANPEKTDHGRLITGYECDSRVADAEFMLAKRQYIAATGRVRGADDVIAYHVRQSFCPGEITPEEANRLGVEFAKRFTKGKHAFIVCTHIDKAHVHNHIIWSSVNLDCDRKFRNFWGSTKAVRRLSDTICIENRADDACKAQAELRKAAIYPHSAAYAKEHGELEQYRASNNANLQCKEAIEAAVREHFDGMYLSHDAAKGVIETYGMDRVMLVLANTVQLQDWDGRYSPRNKEWAKTIPNYNSDTVRCGYALNSHPAVLNGFIDLVREEHLRRQPLTAEDIQTEAERILRELRAPDVPNSPHGTHYIARISPEFLNRAGSKDHDRLMNLLPFRSLAFTGMKGLPGTYVTILASEDRSKELRQPRPSVREHLKQEPKQTAPKAPAHKKREPER